MKRQRRFKTCLKMHDGSWVSLCHAPNAEGNGDVIRNGYTKRHDAEHAKRWYKKQTPALEFAVFENLTPP